MTLNIGGLDLVISRKKQKGPFLGMWAVTGMVVGLVLFVALRSDGGDPDTIAVEVQRKGFPLPLADGRELYVAAVSGERVGLVELYFSNGQKGWLPSSLLAPELDIDALREKTRDVIPGLPRQKELEYPEAAWLELEPSEFSWLCEPETLGMYPSDRRVGELHSAKEEEWVPVEEAPALSEMRYFADKRSLPNLLGALQKELPGMMGKYRLDPVGNDALHLAAGLDGEAAIVFAERSLRYCSNSEYAQRLECYLRLCADAGKYEVVSEFLKRDGHLWDPKYSAAKAASERIGSLLASGNVQGAWAQHQVSLWQGDLSRAAKHLERVPAQLEQAAQKQKKTWAKLAPQVEGRMLRLQASSLEEWATGEEQHAVREALSRVERQVAYRNVPMLERYATLPIPELLQELRARVATYGRASEPVSDFILYLLEQRGYNGTDIPIDQLLWNAIAVRGRGDDPRAAGMFLLTQKTGGIGFDPNKIYGRWAMNNKFTTEAGVYLVKVLWLHGSRRPRVVRDTVIDAMAFSYDCAVRSPEGSGARGYNWVACNNYFNAGDIFGTQLVEEDVLSEISMNNPSRKMRFKFTMHLCETDLVDREPTRRWQLLDYAWEQAELMIEKLWAAEELERSLRYDSDRIVQLGKWVQQLEESEGLTESDQNRLKKLRKKMEKYQEENS